MIEEKQARQVSDHIKLAEICTRIVSFLIIFKFFSFFTSGLALILFLNQIINFLKLKVQLAFDNNELTKMREFFLVLCKRRGQAKKPVVDMVEQC